MAKKENLNYNSWVNHPDLSIDLVFLDVKFKYLKNLKQFVRKVNGEILKYKQGDPAWIAYRKGKTKRKILGIFMISKFSPKTHFDNEIQYTDDGKKIYTCVPYLYNVMVDVISKDAKILNVSLSLMMNVKKDIYNTETIWNWLGNKPKFINLDAPHTNDKAIKFYKKNGFIANEEIHMINDIPYLTMTFSF